MEINLGAIVQGMLEKVGAHLPNVLMGLVVLIIGFWIVNRIVGMLGNLMKRRNVEPSLSKFLGSLVGIILKVMVLLAVAKMFGVDTTSFIAIIGALMIGVGMALNGTIGHFASGVMLLIFKPFKVDDLVIIGGGQMGVVDSISTFNTTLKTPDNRRIIIANSNVTSNDIVNISGQGVAGVELTFGIGYGDDIDKAREIILQVGKECPWVLDDPAHGVVVGELADSSVNLATRPFCKSEHFLDTKFYMIEHVKKAFDKAGISIPFPQTDIHMIQN